MPQNKFTSNGQQMIVIFKSTGDLAKGFQAKFWLVPNNQSVITTQTSSGYTPLDKNATKAPQVPIIELKLKNLLIFRKILVKNSTSSSGNNN